MKISKETDSCGSQRARGRVERVEIQQGSGKGIRVEDYARTYEDHDEVQL